MARRLGSWLLGSAALSLGAVSGCYQHHTADEDALEIEFPAGSYDAGVAIPDADTGVARADAGNCGAPGSIQSFLCGLTGGNTGATGTGTTGTPSIADILNGTQDPAAFGDLLGALTGMGTTGGSSLTDLLAGLGIPSTGGRAPTMPAVPANPMARDAGTGGGRLGGFTTPTAADCANPTSTLTQVICQMQGGQGGQGGRRDAGTGRPTTPAPAPVAPAPVAPAPVAPAPVAPAPVAPAPVAPAPVAPAPVAPAVDAGAPTPVVPVEPAPVVPVAPVEPAPVAPVEPAPVAPVVPVEPAPVVPVEPAPVAPVEPAPVDADAGTAI